MADNRCKIMSLHWLDLYIPHDDASCLRGCRASHLSGSPLPVAKNPHCVVHGLDCGLSAAFRQFPVTCGKQCVLLAFFRVARLDAPPSIWRWDVEAGTMRGLLSHCRGRRLRNRRHSVISARLRMVIAQRCVQSGQRSAFGSDFGICYQS